MEQVLVIAAVIHSADIASDVSHQGMDPGKQSYCPFFEPVPVGA